MYLKPVKIRNKEIHDKIQIQSVRVKQAIKETTMFLQGIVKPSASRPIPEILIY